MKKKAFLMVPTLILTCVLFLVSTHMQKKLINYEPKMKVLFLKEDIMENQKLTEEQFEKREIPISLIANTRIVKDFSEIEGLYAKSTILKGQIAILEQFDSKEKLSIYEVEKDKEKIAIKIKEAENGVSYAIKKHSLVNVYVTIRRELAEGFLPENESLSIGSIEYGYQVIQVLENKEVIECFDIDGNTMKESDGNMIDTIILAVTHEEAKQINLLREVGVFNVTSVS